MWNSWKWIGRCEIHANSWKCICNGKIWRLAEIHYNAFVMGKYEDSCKFNTNEFVSWNMKIHGNSNANEFVVRNANISLKLRGLNLL